MAHAAGGAADSARHSLKAAQLLAGAGTDSPPDETNVPRGEDVLLKRSPFDYVAWLIDLDGTLYRQKLVRSMMALEVVLHGRSSIETLRAFRREHERLRHETLPEGSNPFALQSQRTAERLHVAPDRVSQLVDQWMFERPGKWLRLFRRRGLIALIAEHRKRGGKTALVSDYPAQRKLSAMGISHLFDVVVASGEPGGPHQLKPSAVGFLSAAGTLQLAPSQCLVIGDRADADGEAAQRADMRFWHVSSRWTA
jgi:FMN phosphatase YigB (HAD superfamily)